MDEFTLLESLDTGQLVRLRDTDTARLQSGGEPHFVIEALEDRIHDIDFILAKRASEVVT